MNESVVNFIISTASTLAAGAITWAVVKLINWAKNRSTWTTGTANTAHKTIRATNAPAIRQGPTLARAIDAALYIVCFSFFIYQLRVLMDQAGQPSRSEVLVIAFWVWWFLWLLTELLAGKPFVGGARATN